MRVNPPLNENTILKSGSFFEEVPEDVLRIILRYLTTKDLLKTVMCCKVLQLIGSQIYLEEIEPKYLAQNTLNMTGSFLLESKKPVPNFNEVKAAVIAYYRLSTVSFTNEHEFQKRLSRYIKAIQKETQPKASPISNHMVLLKEALVSFSLLRSTRYREIIAPLKAEQRYHSILGILKLLMESQSIYSAAFWGYYYKEKCQEIGNSNIYTELVNQHMLFARVNSKEISVVDFNALISQTPTLLNFLKDMYTTDRFKSSIPESFKVTVDMIENSTGKISPRLLMRIVDSSSHIILENSELLVKINNCQFAHLLLNLNSVAIKILFQNQIEIRNRFLSMNENEFNQYVIQLTIGLIQYQGRSYIVNPIDSKALFNICIEILRTHELLNAISDLTLITLLHILRTEQNHHDHASAIFQILDSNIELTKRIARNALFLFICSDFNKNSILLIAQKILDSYKNSTDNAYFFAMMNNDAAHYFLSKNDSTLHWSHEQLDTLEKRHPDLRGLIPGERRETNSRLRQNLIIDDNKIMILDHFIFLERITHLINLILKFRNTILILIQKFITAQSYVLTPTHSNQLLIHTISICSVLCDTLVTIIIRYHNEFKFSPKSNHTTLLEELKCTISNYLLALKLLDRQEEFEHSAPPTLSEKMTKPFTRFFREKPNNIVYDIIILQKNLELILK